MFESAGTQDTQKDLKLYTDLFSSLMTGKLNTLLKPYADKIQYHTLDKGFPTETLQLFSYNDLLHPTLLNVDEYADYRELKTMGLTDVIPAIVELADHAADSYFWNVKLVATRGGSYLPIGKKLHITDLSTLHVNVATKEPSVCLDSSSDFEGWIAYRYKFAGTKL